MFDVARCRKVEAAALDGGVWREQRGTASENLNPNSWLLCHVELISTVQMRKQVQHITSHKMSEQDSSSHSSSVACVSAGTKSGSVFPQKPECTCEIHLMDI